jgi:plastocyanin
MILTAGEAPLQAGKPADGGKDIPVADEGQGRRRRSRGRRRGRQDAHREESRQEQEDASKGDISADDLSSEVDNDAEEKQEESGKSTRRERQSVAPGTPGSPMDFWRSGRARSARARRPTAEGASSGPQGLVARITNMYLPPWVPVVGIIVVVFGILGLLFVVRSATGAPRIGEDHWHAPYTFWVCGEKQAPAPTWEKGVHTHGDGIIHIHPYISSEEGTGARLAKWFEYGGGKLDGDEVRLPGSPDTWKNGDICPEGTPEAGAEGEVQVFVNGEKIDYDTFVPHDGDIVRIVFGASEEVVELDDRIVLDENGVTREIPITITQPDDNDESSTTFTPSQISVDLGEKVKLIVTNDDEVSHGLVVRGFNVDSQSDDFVTVADGKDPKTGSNILEPGESGFAVIQFNDPGQPVEFYDPATIATGSATGTITITNTQVTPTPGADDTFDEEIDVTITDGAFDPDEITVNAGDRVKLNLINEGDFGHNMYIAGPDGEFFTDDDIHSDDIAPGETVELIIGLEAGTYEFLDQFNPETMTGTLIIE